MCGWKDDGRDGWLTEEMRGWKEDARDGGDIGGWKGDGRDK